MLTQATQEVVDRRFGGSVNHAHRTLKISREVITRMLDGDPPTLEVVEKWARAIKEPVNKWRQLCSYLVVEETTGRQRLIDRLLELARRHPEKTIPVPLLHGGTDDLTPEQADALADDIEDKIRRGVL